MLVRIMETSPERAEQLAREWGVKPCAGQALDVIHAAIAAAYQREVEAEARRAVRRMRVASDVG